MVRAEGEFFTGILQPGFADYVLPLSSALRDRQQVSVAEYERLFNQQLGMTAENVTLVQKATPRPCAGQKITSANIGLTKQEIGEG